MTSFYAISFSPLSTDPFDISMLDAAIGLNTRDLSVYIFFTPLPPPPILKNSSFLAAAPTNDFNFSKLDIYAPPINSECICLDCCT
jgi:hypothetical protein